MRLSKRFAMAVVGCAALFAVISNFGWPPIGATAKPATARERTSASKAKKIEIVMVKSGVRAVAELVEAKAPKTCAVLWKVLEKPLIAQGMHAAWTGRCVYIVIPEASRTFDPAAIPFENATLYPIPGDVMFAYSPQSVEGDISGPLPEIGIVYGREARFYEYSGYHAMNLWARITEGLEELAVECAKLRSEGVKEFRISRLAEQP